MAKVYHITLDGRVENQNQKRQLVVWAALAGATRERRQEWSGMVAQLTQVVASILVSLQLGVVKRLATEHHVAVHDYRLQAVDATQLWAAHRLLHGHARLLYALQCRSHSAIIGKVQYLDIAR